jgi:ParB family chromosome partitioning protein
MDLDDQRVFELAMVENLQREDLNAVDKATAFREYLGRYGGTQEELAGRLGLDRSTVSNLIRLLDLPQEVLEAVREGAISQGHARALLGLEDAESQRDACRRIIRENLSVRQTEALVATGIPTPARPRIRRDQAHSHEPKAPHLVELEQSLHQRFGTAVLIRARTPERGQIIIDYNSQEEFDRVSALIRGEVYQGS